MKNVAQLWVQLAPDNILVINLVPHLYCVQIHKSRCSGCTKSTTEYIVTFDVIAKATARSVLGYVSWPNYSLILRHAQKQILNMKKMNQK